MFTMAELNISTDFLYGISTTINNIDKYYPDGEEETQ